MIAQEAGDEGRGGQLRHGHREADVRRLLERGRHIRIGQPQDDALFRRQLAGQQGDFDVDQLVLGRHHQGAGRGRLGLVQDLADGRVADIARTFWDTIVDFFKKDSIWGMLLFVFLYRSSEGLLLIEGPLFLQASPDVGGIGLSLKEKGIIDGTVSTVVSLGAGLLGGAFMAKFGLKRNTLFFMALCLNLPHITFVILSQLAGPGHGLSLWTVGTLVTIEKFGYSFGFVANMLYMMQQISPGKYHMTHYAFANSLMNLMLVPTQMISGPLADHFGYKTYFIVVMFAAIPSLLGSWFAPFPRKPDNGHPTG